jgi:hypothetical protein
MAQRLWHSTRQGLTRARWQLAGLTALLLVLACVLVAPQWLVRWELGAQTRALTVADRAKAINDVRTTLLQGIAGTVLLLGAYFTYRQLQTARDQLQIAQEGQITERFSRAIEQLGNDKEDVQLGGIYTLACDLTLRAGWAGRRPRSAGVEDGAGPSGGPCGPGRPAPGSLGWLLDRWVTHGRSRAAAPGPAWGARRSLSTSVRQVSREIAEAPPLGRRAC